MLLNMLSIFLVILFLGCVLILLSLIIGPKLSDYEKLSPYECGFAPFNDARFRFDIHFYLISILFLIFDLEIVFIFPWSVYLQFVGFFGFSVMIIFLFFLVIGFIFEWQVGALNW